MFNAGQFQRNQASDSLPGSHDSQKRGKKMKVFEVFSSRLAYRALTAVAALGIAAAVQAAAPPPGTVVATLNNPSPAPGEDFGAEVNASKKFLAVGAPNGTETGLLPTGVVYLYDTKTYTEQHAFETDTVTTDTNTSYGAAISIGAKDILIGEPGSGDSTTTPTDINGSTSAGSAWLYDLKTFALKQHYLNPDPDDDDDFSSSVLDSKKFYAIGAPGDDAGTTDSGVVYTYDVKTLSTTPTHILLPSQQIEGQHFGAALALAGTTLAVGAPSTESSFDAGQVYLFETKTFTSAGIKTAIASNPGDRFGESLAGGKQLAAGAPGYNLDISTPNTGAAFTLDIKKGTTIRMQNPSPDYGDEFGYSVAFIGKNLLVGAPGDDNTGVDSGRAYVFNSAGLLLQTIENPNPTAGGRFGYSVTSDGKNAIIGAPGNGSAGVVYVIVAAKK